MFFSFCAKEKVIPPTNKWQNTLTPRLENNNQRDTVFDDEDITFSTSDISADRYIWSWGDGSKNDTTQTIYAIHQFKRIGMNIVKLRVERDNTYGEKTTSIWVKHRTIIPCGFRIDCSDSLYVQNTSHFVANINTPNCQSNCNFEYYWDFGDNSTGIGYHTTHNYKLGGVYLVTLRVTRCSGSDITIQKPVVVSGISDIVGYKCQCKDIAGTNTFGDTINTQNIPFNPIKVDGRVLQRNGNSNRYTGEYDCDPNGCDTYILEVFNNMDSIDYLVILPPFVQYRCSGRRI